MSDSITPRPRRALEPRDDEPEDTGARRPSRAIWSSLEGDEFSDDLTSDDAEAGNTEKADVDADRAADPDVDPSHDEVAAEAGGSDGAEGDRAVDPASDAVAATRFAPDGEREAADGDPSTPVPPPAPVLPTPQPTRGSRFSGSDEPADAGYAPRRSALSAHSPFDPADADESSTSSPSDEASGESDTLTQAGAAASAVAGDFAAETGASTASDEPTAASDATPATARLTARAASFWADSRRRLLAFGIIGVALIALIVTLVVNQSRPTALGSPTPSTPASSLPASLTEAALLTPTDLAALGDDPWTVAPAASASPSATSPAPSAAPTALVCAGDPPGKSDVALERTLTSTAHTASQRHLVFADEAAAAAAYGAAAARLGGCATTGALVTSGYAVTGVADSAAAVTVTVQEATPTLHTLVLTRTGKSVDLVDVSGTRAVKASSVATAVASALTRFCSDAGGTCPKDAKVAAAPPPAAAVAGWLTESDLPRVTVGAGRWGGTAPAAPNLVGSQCEGMDLNAVSAESAQHRTYLLADDNQAPSGFGVDEAIYTMPKASAATSLLKKLTTNIDGCRARTKTATVKQLDKVTTTDAKGKELSATAYAISQKISDKKSVAFRVSIATVGDRVVYLLANPAADFDFTDKQWTALTARALQRVTQLR